MLCSKLHFQKCFIKSYLRGQSVPTPPNRFRAKREQLGTFRIILPPSQGQNLVLAVIYVPLSLGSGPRWRRRWCLRLKSCLNWRARSRLPHLQTGLAEWRMVTEVVVLQNHLAPLGLTKLSCAALPISFGDAFTEPPCTTTLVLQTTARWFCTREVAGPTSAGVSSFLLVALEDAIVSQSQELFRITD